MGKLFYVIGASGVGKDSIMNYARGYINGTSNILFAHRYITRPANAGGENHVALTQEEFAQRKAFGFFAMHWESHGHHYGIGIEVLRWMDGGGIVVVNGSREYLPVARQLYPFLQVILIVADPAIIEVRLIARQRETAEAIKKRMDRSKEISFDASGCIVLENNTTIEDAGGRFLEVLGR